MSVVWKYLLLFSIQLFFTINSTKSYTCKNYEKPKILNRYSYNVSPKDVTEEMKELYLSSCAILHIKEDAFRDYRHVEKLSLEFNFLTYLQAAPFSGMDKLSYVSLRHNLLMMVSPSVFSSMINLNYLYLSSNLLEIDEFDEMLAEQEIEEVDLSDNNPSCEKLERLLTLQSFNGYFPCTSNFTLHHAFKAKSIEKLNLSNNNISILASGIFAGFSDLSELDISNNRIVDLDENLFKDTVNLSLLKADNNRLIRLEPGLFETTVNVEYLFLAHNNISQLHPEQFSSMVNLKYLRIHHNKLRSLPEKIFKMNTKLNVIDLGYNELEEIHPKLFQNNDKLVMLALDNNRLKRISPVQFCNVINLEQLFLTNNKIEKLSEDLFEFNSNLKTLDVSMNLLSRFPPRIFANNPKVFSLNLADNMLTEFNFDIIKHLERFSYLTLANNQIKYLAPEVIFFQNGWSFKIDMSQNELTWLPRYEQNDGGKTKRSFSVKIARNPLRCSCLKEFMVSLGDLINVDKENFSDGKTAICIVDYDPNCSTRPIASGLHRFWRLIVGENTPYGLEYFPRDTEGYMSVSRD